MQESSNCPMDLIWGVKGIAEVIGRTPTQTNHLLASGALPGKKVGERWVVDRSRLAAFFAGDAA